MFWQLDALAAERCVTRTRLVRQLLDAGLRDGPEPLSEPPSKEGSWLEQGRRPAARGNTAWNPPV